MSWKTFIDVSKWQGHIDWDVMKSAQRKLLEESWERYENGDNFILWGDDAKGMTKEKFISSRMGCGISSFAILKDGEWIEQGDMGWFGMSTDKVSRYDWNRQVDKLIEELDDNEMITLVDCHI